MAAEEAVAVVKDYEATGHFRWSYCLLARSQGGQAAKDAVLMSVSAISVMTALMFTLTLPAVINPPQSLAIGADDPELGYNPTYLRPWFWFSLVSTLSSIVALVFACLLLTYLTPVPPSGVEAYLERVKPLYVGSVAGFIVSVALQGAALLATIRPILPIKDFVAATALMGVTFGSLLWIFWRVDSRSYGFNEYHFQKWRQGKGREQGGKILDQGHQGVVASVEVKRSAVLPVTGHQ